MQYYHKNDLKVDFVVKVVAFEHKKLLRRQYFFVIITTMQILQLRRLCILDEKKPKSNIMKNLVYLTQMGMSLAMPLVICIAGSAWLKDKFELGGWVVILGIVLGIGSMAVTLRDYVISFSRKAQKSTKEQTSWNKRW